MAIPVIAAAAFPSTVRDTWLMPESSTTPYIMVTSAAPTYGDVAGGHGRDDQLRQSDWQIPDSARGDRRAAAATEREHAVQLYLGGEAVQHGSHALAHGGDRHAPVVSVPKRVDGGTGGPGHLLLPDGNRVGEPGGGADPGVHDEHVYAVLAEPAGHPLVFGALGVQRADERYGRPGHRASCGTSRVTAPS
ncbi:MAG: hypothetical protein QOE61_3520 [Micromonosporaceae bacterium]|nr:hypothetical protein [Micromonosporaceae bacterium]